MIYIPSQKVLFIHVSRTGGTTISNFLYQNFVDTQQILPQHSAVSQIEKEPNLDDVFSFAFVRNPWERMVSWYTLIGQSSIGKEVRDPNHIHWKGFDEFIEKWSKLTFQVNGHSRLALCQKDQLTDCNDKLLVKQVGKYENFEKDWMNILKQIKPNLTHNLEVVNNSKHHHYSEYFSTFGKELIETVFWKDIECWNYSFEEENNKINLATC